MKTKRKAAVKVNKTNSSNGSMVDISLKFDEGWSYSPAPESTDHVSIKERYGLFIGGKFVKPALGKYFATINPATENKISEVANASSADVDKAVKAARKAFGPWSSLPARERGKYVYRISRMMQEKARELAVIESMDGGKAIREARDIDIPLAAAHFFYYAGWADKLDYAFPNKKPTPLGVAGQIIPWNFPLLMAAWKIAPAIAAGNTVVLKSAETTPLTSMKLAEIIQEAGLPDGVVNIITGAGDTTQILIRSRSQVALAWGRSFRMLLQEQIKRSLWSLEGRQPTLFSTTLLWIRQLKE